MLRRSLDIYQYAGPALLTPLAAWLWWRHYNGNMALVALALGVPIVHAYVVAGIGTNVLKVWSFNARLRVGRFRPHHGFLFGSATAMIALPFMGSPATLHDGGDTVRCALLVGAALLAVNWGYDAIAIDKGVLEVNNQPWADGAGAWRIAADYVVWFFGVFGVLYGGGLKLAEPALLRDPSLAGALWAAAALLAATLSIPTVLYIVASWLRHGHSGCAPVARLQDGRGK